MNKIMDKQCLDVQQMQHLQELGLELKKDTILVWARFMLGKTQISDWGIAYNHSAITDNSQTIPAYSLQDVLEHLPVKLGVNGKIHITRDFLTSAWTVEYFEGATLGRVSFDNEELIDAAYDMLCLLVEKGYVKNKA